MSNHAVCLNIEMLLRAADYIEKHGDVKPKDRVLDHVYASTLPMPQQRKSKTRKSIGSRFTHNELEKNRRAHLRYCLEKLKENVLLGSSSSRHTTLGLLNKAKMLIMNLKETSRKLESIKTQEMRQQQYLRRCLDQTLCGATTTYRERAEHSLSESSSGSTSRSPFSEQDDVDIVGSDDSLADSDDQDSNGSDESVEDGAKRLTLTDVL